LFKHKHWTDIHGVYCADNDYLVKANGKVRLHKVKKTSATSYHIGRTWHLDEIKSIENVDVSAMLLH